jgi:hypothetical protein
VTAFSRQKLGRVPIQSSSGASGRTSSAILAIEYWVSEPLRPRRDASLSDLSIDERQIRRDNHDMAERLGNRRLCGAVALAVALPLLGCTRKTSPSNSKVTTSQSPTASTSAGPAAPAAIRPVEVVAAAGVPDWCARIVTENVRSLGPALARLERPEDRDAVIRVVAASSADLSASLDRVPSTVTPALAAVVKALDLLRSDPSNVESLSTLAQSLQGMETATQTVCGYST